MRGGSDESASEWPSHFPEGCPPGDAHDANCVVYRLTRVPPSVDDCKSALERNFYVSHPPCQRAALSCLADRATAERYQRLPRFRQDHVVALVELTPPDGKLKPTMGIGHLSLWLRATALALFHLRHRLVS
jgi:hypothetical protein